MGLNASLISNKAPRRTVIYPEMNTGLCTNKRLL